MTNNNMALMAWLQCAVRLHKTVMTINRSSTI